MDINQSELISIAHHLKDNFSINNISDCQALLFLTYINTYIINGDNQELNAAMGQLYTIVEQQLMDKPLEELKSHCECSRPDTPPPQGTRIPEHKLPWENRAHNFKHYATFIPSPLINYTFTDRGF